MSSNISNPVTYYLDLSSYVLFYFLFIKLNIGFEPIYRKGMRVPKNGGTIILGRTSHNLLVFAS